MILWKMTVDFIPLKLYIEKEFKLGQQKGVFDMRHIVLSNSRAMSGSYYFSKVRFAGRFERVKKLSG